METRQHFCDRIYAISCEGPIFMKRVLKNADISTLSKFFATFLKFFVNFDKLYQIPFTCQVLGQLDHPNRNYRGRERGRIPPPPPPALPICKRPGLFRVKVIDIRPLATVQNSVSLELMQHKTLNFVINLPDVENITK